MSVETIPHTHTHTEAPAHIHILTTYTKFNLHANRQQTEKTAALNRKYGSSVVSEKKEKKVLKLDLKESGEILCQRGRVRSRGPKSVMRNLEAESIRSRAESMGGCVKLKWRSGVGL